MVHHVLGEKLMPVWLRSGSNGRSGQRSPGRFCRLAFAAGGKASESAIFPLA
jgi:hypothetical protein